MSKHTYRTCLVLFSWATSCFLRWGLRLLSGACWSTHSGAVLDGTLSSSFLSPAPNRFLSELSCWLTPCLSYQESLHFLWEETAFCPITVLSFSNKIRGRVKTCGGLAGYCSGGSNFVTASSGVTITRRESP
ncbi:hypothetical protein B0H11DRAFT_1996480, partial [Mycena galericulata]